MSRASSAASPSPSPRWDEDGYAAAGLLTRAQAVAGSGAGSGAGPGPGPSCGIGSGTRLSDAALAWRVDSRRWTRLHRGVYLTRTGPIDWHTRACAAVLAAGPEAALRGGSAAYAWGLVERPGRTIELLVPATRQVVAPPGIDVRRTRVPYVVRGMPPRVTVERTLVDLAQTLSTDELAAILARAIGDRLTTRERVLAELGSWARHGRRAIVRGMLSDVGDGAQGALEVRFVRGVLRAHGLPIGRAQVPLGELGGQIGGQIGELGGQISGQDSGQTGGHPGRQRMDRAFEAQRLLVELDGLRFHRGRALVTDRAKSRRAVAADWAVVRYGWEETVPHACATAAELELLLQARG